MNRTALRLKEDFRVQDFLESSNKGGILQATYVKALRPLLEITTSLERRVLFSLSS